MARHRRHVVLLATLLLAAGCIEESEPPVDVAAAELETPSATLLDRAGFTPPAQPPSAGPASEVFAAVDLSTVGSGSATAVFAIGTEDGAYVVLDERAGEEKGWLATVGSTDDGLAVTDAVEIPLFSSTTGPDAMAVLDDGTVVMSGQFDYPDDLAAPATYGFVAADPVSGEFRQVTVFPEEHPGSRRGRSTFSADGQRLFTYVLGVGLAVDRLLVAVDVASGSVVAEHDMRTAATTAGYGYRSIWGLAPRTDGGVRVLVHAGVEEGVEAFVPIVVDYGPDLTPIGEPVPLTGEPAGSAAVLVPGAGDGTVFAVVEQQDGEGSEVIAVPQGATEAIPLIRSPDVDWLDEHTVEPGQVYLTIPLDWGAASIDLTTAEAATPVDIGCREGLGVRRILPGAGGTTLLLGDCGGTGTLWIVGD